MVQNIVLIGTNPVLESPVLNARIRKAWTQGANVSVIGENIDLTYESTHLGTGRDALAKLVAADHSATNGQENIVIVGQGALTEADGAAVLGTAMKLSETMQAKFMVLHTAAGRVGAMDIGATNDDANGRCLCGRGYL